MTKQKIARATSDARSGGRSEPSTCGKFGVRAGEQAAEDDQQQNADRDGDDDAWSAVTAPECRETAQDPGRRPEDRRGQRQHGEEHALHGAATRRSRAPNTRTRTPHTRNTAIRPRGTCRHSRARARTNPRRPVRHVRRNDKRRDTVPASSDTPEPSTAVTSASEASSTSGVGDRRAVSGGHIALRRCCLRLGGRRDRGRRCRDGLDRRLLRQAGEDRDRCHRDGREEPAEARRSTTRVRSRPPRRRPRRGSTRRGERAPGPGRASNAKTRTAARRPPAAA